MGKNKGSSSNLGRSLIKDRFGGSKQRKYVADNSMLHTTEIQDGYDWGRLNLTSVTEESSFQEFLSTAELAGTEFQAEKLNIKFINPRCNVGLLSNEEQSKRESEHEKHKDVIKIPRRPPWDSTTTADQLDFNEKEAFLKWRRSLAMLQEEQGLLLTPYEKNLEFWRQLWRVVERSDVVFQIVDARNPLLFRCEDLENYVKEVNSNKISMILINKADFLSETQRQCWAEYFNEINVQVAFFSAVLEEIDEESVQEGDESNVEGQASDFHDKTTQRKQQNTIEGVTNNLQQLENDLQRENLLDSSEEHLQTEKKDLSLDEITSSLKELADNVEKCAENLTRTLENHNKALNTSKLLTRTQLIDLFRTIHTKPKVTEGVTTIGLVGYPNVGKSSTINALMTVKKVSVSATPGKTKHFQTLYLDKDILLCDCPGLVMPSFVFTKAEMVINGILPIDQMRDHVPPVNLVSHLIPRYVLEDHYGIMLPKPMEGEDEDRPPTSEELLNAYGYNRGFMTANGQPDNPRAARYILKDFMNGKLLFAHAPPGVSQQSYHPWPEKRRTVSKDHVMPPREARASKPNRVTSEDLDKLFFKQTAQGVHSKGKLGKSTGLPASVSNLGDETGKPWKKVHRHENKNKKEKLRRVYAHLDQH